MKLTKTLSLVIAALVLALALCACSIQNPNYTVLKVGDMKIGVNAYYNNYNYLAYTYQTYGLYNVSTPELLKVMQDQVFDMLVEKALPVLKAKQQGITLTAEEEQKVMADYDEQIKSIAQSYASEVDASITDEAAKLEAEMKLFKDGLVKNGWNVNEYLKLIENDLRDTAMGQKYLDTLYADVNTTEEAAKAYFEEQLADKKAKYAEDPVQYYTDYTNYANGGTAIPPYTTAEDYRFCKHILIKFAAEGEAKDVDGLVALVKEKIAAGEDFDALVEQFGEDPGMQSEPTKTNGYLVGPAVIDKYYDGFALAALNLKNIGDVTPEPIETQSGYHFIKYESDVEVKDLSFEDVKADLIEEMNEDAKVELYRAKVQEWKEEFTVTKYYDRVSGIR